MRRVAALLATALATGAASAGAQNAPGERAPEFEVTSVRRTSRVQGNAAWGSSRADASWPAT